MTTFNFKWKYEKSTVVVRVSQTTQNFVISHVFGFPVRQHRTWLFHDLVLQRTAKKCTKIYNERERLLFCSLNLLFSDVLVAVVLAWLASAPQMTQGGTRVVQYSDKFMHSIVLYYIHITID